MEELNELIEMLNSGMDLALSAIAIAAYILQSLAVFTIAKRRCIKNPWMAWVPVVNVWILGSIADQYRYVTKREIKNNRKILLGLNIAMTVLGAFLVVMLVVLVYRFVIAAGGDLNDLIRAAENGNFRYFEPLLEEMLTPLLALIFLLLPFGAVATVFAVFYYITLYDVYKSCMPSRAKLFLLISIFGNFEVSGLEAVFLMICRNKDLGMPPRKPVVQPIVEVAPVIEMPVEKPVLNQEIPQQETVEE